MAVRGLNQGSTACDLEVGPTALHRAAAIRPFRLGVLGLGAFALLGCAIGCSSGAAPATADAARDGKGDTAFETKVAPFGTKRLFVLDTIKFARQKPPGTVLGWDLDGKVSGEDDKATCGKKDYVSPDGVVGIDNQFSLLVPLIEASGIAAFESLLQASVESGGVLLMVELVGLDSLTDDPDVTVRIRAGQGIPLLGTDGKVLTGQTFHLNKRDPATVCGKGKLTGGTIDVGPFDIDLPLQVFGKDYTLEMRGGRVRFHVVDDQRIDAGLVGGGITLSSIAKIAKTAAEDQGNIDDIVESLTSSMGDLAQDGTGTCTQMSAALTFTGVSAFFYPADVTKDKL